MNEELQRELLDKLNKITHNLNTQILEVQSIAAALRMEVVVEATQNIAVDNLVPEVELKPEPLITPEPASDIKAEETATPKAPELASTPEPVENPETANDVKEAPATPVEKPAESAKEAPKETDEPLLLTTPTNEKPAEIAEPEPSKDDGPLLLTTPIKAEPDAAKKV